MYHPFILYKNLHYIHIQYRYNLYYKNIMNLYKGILCFN